MNTHRDLFSDCPHCHADRSVARPNPLWRLALATAWLVFGAMVVGIGLIGPFILFAGPVVLFAGAGVLGYLHGRVGEEPACSECGKIARQPGPVASSAVPLRPARGVFGAAA